MFATTVTCLAQGQKPTPKTQEVFAPYWSSEPGWDTQLQLKNNLTSGALIVTPVLRLATGQEIPLDAVTIPSNDSVSLWVNEELLQSGPSLLGQPGSYGSVVLKFSSLSARNLHATVVPWMHGEPTAFHMTAHPTPESEGRIQGEREGSQEGIWWLPRSGFEEVLVISNSSGKQVTGDLSLFDAAGKQWSEPVSLGAHETQRLSVNELVQKSGLGGLYGGMNFEVQSSAPAIDSVHFLYDGASGFSSALEMFDRDPTATLAERVLPGANQVTLWAPMLALSSPDPSIGLPDKTILQPTIFLRNVTAKKIAASIVLDWRSESATGEAKLPGLKLVPFATQQILLGEMQKQLGIPNDAYWALVTLTTSGSPDDVIAVASSYDASGQYDVGARFFGGLGQHFAGGQWRVDAMRNHIIAVTNGGSKSTDALLTLHYEDGKQKYELQQSIAAGGQMWVNVADLIRNRVADRNGNVLPADVASGTYEVQDMNPQPGSLLHASLAVDNSAAAHGPIPQLATCCSTAVSFSPSSFDLTSDPIWEPIIANSYDQCTGDRSVYTPDMLGWTSGNPSIAQVQPAQVRGMSAGDRPLSKVKPIWSMWGTEQTAC